LKIVPIDLWGREAFWLVQFIGGHLHCGSPLKKRSTANAARAEMPKASPLGSGTGATGGTSQKFEIVQAGA
jgi:hypothetical protein